MQNNPVLKIENLNVRFKTPNGLVKAVNGVSLEVFQGETLGIVGESGCGKSVTSLAIMGLLPNPIGYVEDGSIFLEDKEISRLKDREMKKIRGNDIAMIFQEPMTSLNPVFTIGEQLSEPLKQHTNLGKKDIKKKIIEMLKVVGIPRAEEIINEYPHQLSGGMRQRVMISLAMLCEPKLLIADEPTTALDVTIQAQILELMKEINKTKNMSMVLITHDLGVVAEMCDRVTVMYAGQVVESTDVRTLFNEAKHPYTQGLLTSMPNANERKKELFSIKGNVPRPDELPKGCAFSTRCPKVFDKCLEENPPLIKLEKQSCRCWLYEGADREVALNVN
jgi:peptide/nickel transport system ATP-binding protein